MRTEKTYGDCLAGGQPTCAMVKRHTVILPLSVTPERVVTLLSLSQGVRVSKYSRHN